MRRFRFSWIRICSYLTACCLLSLFILDAPVLFLVAEGRAAAGEVQKKGRFTGQKVIQLPAPSQTGSISVEEAISKRRSIRQFADKPLDYVKIGQLAWAGQGITDKERNLRAAPSAGAVYPIELYLVTAEGSFVYRPDSHSLEQVSQSDLRKKLSAAAQEQGAVADASCDIVIAGSIRKLAAQYGKNAEKFMLLEAGHIAENIQLQAVTLGLGSVPVGAFDVKSVDKVCELRGDLEPLLIVCVGFPFVQEKSQGESQQAGKTADGSKKALLIVPPAGFRDEELLETQRILEEGGIKVEIASSKIGVLQGVLGNITASGMTLDKVSVQDFDAVIFIGGPGAVDYFTNPAALSIAREAAARNKVLAAISIAPTILANAGVLRGVRATGFLPQREQMLKGGAQYTGSPVERDGLIITATDPSAVAAFAQAIIASIQEKQPTAGKTP